MISFNFHVDVGWNLMESRTATSRIQIEHKDFHALKNSIRISLIAI